MSRNESRNKLIWLFGVFFECLGFLLVLLPSRKRKLGKKKRVLLSGQSKPPSPSPGDQPS